MILSIKALIISSIVLLGSEVTLNSDIKTTDPLTQAIENKSCSSFLTGWDVTSKGEWKGNDYIITITCNEGGTRDCPQTLPGEGD